MKQTSSSDNQKILPTLGLQSKTIRFCLPVIIGSYNPSAPKCAQVFSNFFTDVIKAADGTVKYSGPDSLPNISVASVLDRVGSLLREHNLPASPHLSKHTVRSVVKHLVLHKAVFVSDIFGAPKYDSVPLSHVREEATRSVVEHCVGSIRTILDSVEASSLHASTPAVQQAAVAGAADLPSLASKRPMPLYLVAALGVAVVASLLVWRARRK